MTGPTRASSACAAGAARTVTASCSTSGGVTSRSEWHGRLTPVDLRALSPLKWQHVNPYGTFTLNMQERLPLEQGARVSSPSRPKFWASLGYGLFGQPPLHAVAG